MNHRFIPALRLATGRALASGFAVAATGVAGPVAASPLSAQASARNDSISAPIRDVHYDVTFMHANAARRVVDVSMSFTTIGSAPVVLSLPAWTPGAYEIANFARWVSNFDAVADGGGGTGPAASGGGRGAGGAGGHALTWDKLDYDTWRILPAGARSIRITFQYRADTLDNAGSWAKPDFLLFNGTNLFMYPEGNSLDFTGTVTIHTEPEWNVTTGMASTGKPQTFSAPNFHDLVDMPFFIGHYDVDSVRVTNRWVRYATYPTGSIPAQVRQTALDQVKRVIPPEAAVFGETPWETYTIMQIVDSSFGGASGLEHQNSHVDVLAPAYVGSEFQPSLYAHEIFHSWNVKRLRPAEMWPYQYSHPQPTPWLWVSEGITDYYADLAEVRGGVIEAKGFYALTAEKINEVLNTVPVALEDASLNTWIHPVDGTEYIYYPKGSLAGLALDIMIRDVSDNKHSLDDVMRSLYLSAYKRGHGFTSADWWNAVTAAAAPGGSAGKSFAVFNAKYINGREPFPWDSILRVAGLRVRQDRVPRLGVLTQQDPNGIVVANVSEGSSAAAAGVKVGDYLISVGDIAVEDQQFGARLRAKYGASVEGAPLAVKVKRGTDVITLAGKLQFADGDVAVEEDPTAGAKAVRIREGILKGMTGR